MPGAPAMSDPVARESLGLLGGTGPQGRGLAARWALAGHRVYVGSRAQERAEAAVEDVASRLEGDTEAAARVVPATNDVVAEEAEIVVVALPYGAQQPALPPLAEVIGDKIVLNVVNPMEFDELGPKAVPVEAGSAAEECQLLLPEARVVSGFHDVSSQRLLDVHESIRTHVLLCGDDRDAVHRVEHLAARIEGMWGVYCGPLRNSQYIENLTPVILAINRHYGIEAGVLIDGVEPEAGLHAGDTEGAVTAGQGEAG